MDSTLQQYIEDGSIDELRKVQPEVFLNSVTGTGDTALHLAVGSRKTISVDVIHEQCPKLVHQTNNDDQTPLHLAARQGHWEIVKILMYTWVRGEEHDIESGHEKILDKMLITMVDNHWDTALHLAALHEHIDVVKLLTEAYPDYRYSQNIYGEYPLDIALDKRFLGVVKQIIVACVHSDCVTPDRLKSGCLHWIETENIDALKVIFKRYPSDIRTDTGNSTLHCAVEWKDDQLVNELVKIIEERDYCIKNLDGNTALHLAAQQGRLSFVEILYGVKGKTRKLGVLLNQRNNDGKTALHLAAETYSYEVAVYLIKRYLVPDNKLATMLDNEKNTILHSATKVNATTLVQYILNNDSDEMPLLRMRNNKKNTALHLAVLNNHYEVVELLTSADREYRYSANSDGLTPLYIAVNKENYSLVRTIISACPSSSYAAPNLDTALRRSLEFTDTENRTAKLLLGNQPEQCKVRNGDGWTVLHKATEYGNLGIIKEMVRLCPGCLEDVTYNDGRNFLHLAASYGYVEMVKYIMETSEIPVAVLNQKDHEGNTPLHYAVTSGNNSLELAEPLLYDDRVDKNIKNKGDRTALELIKFPYDEKRAGVYDREKVDEKELKDRREFELVVSALIATVSFTAGITVPGGFNSDEPNKGMAVLSKKTSFDAFVISNTCALVLSLSAVFSHFCTRLLKKKKDIDLQAALATMCTLGAIFFMMVSFITGSYAVLSVSLRLAITLCVLSCTFFISAFYPILLLAIQYINEWGPR